MSLNSQDLKAIFADKNNNKPFEVVAYAAFNEYPIKDVVLDAANSLLKGPTSMRSLSPTELKLLVHLFQAEGTPVSRSSLKFSCWHQIAVSENALDRKIYEVRKALTDVGSLLKIETIYGEGFLLK